MRNLYLLPSFALNVNVLEKIKSSKKKISQSLENVFCDYLSMIQYSRETVKHFSIMHKLLQKWIRFCFS